MAIIPALLRWPLERQTASGLLRRVKAWWIAEFLALFPESISTWLAGHGRMTLVLAPYVSGVRIDLLKGRQTIAIQHFHGDALSSAILEEFLRAHAVPKATVVRSVEMAPERFFQRSFDIPLAARGTVDRLCIVEIERKTPFRLAEIVHGHRIEALDAEKLRIHQTIVRRDFVENDLRRCGLSVDDIHSIRSGPSSDASGGPAIDLRDEEPIRVFDVAVKALFVFAVMLLVFDIGVIYWRQAQELDRLDSELASAKAESMAIRTRAEGILSERKALEQVTTRKATSYGAVAILDEVTRLLTDDNWLTEFRLTEEGKSGEEYISLTGYATAAASLVDQFDSSPFFVDAALTSPITPDQTEQRERFSLRARLRPVNRTDVSGAR